MIYVLKSIGLKDQAGDVNLNNLVEIIKIGYTKDGGDKKRMELYSTHNKSYKVLFKIKNGTQEDEHNLHQYFRDFQYDREWFLVDKDNTIESFFNKYNTIDKIRNKIPKTASNKVKSEFLSEVWKRLGIIFPINSIDDYKDMSKLKESLIKEISSTQIYDIEGFYRWLEDKNIKDFDKNMIEKEISKPIAEEFKDEFNKFFEEYEVLPTLYKKLKYLCEYEFSSEESKQNVLNQVKEKHFKEYYNSLGPEGCRACAYSVSNINKKLNIKTFNKTQLILDIYSTFSEGNKYSNKFIKETLKQIYSDANYEATPKASDLDEYFDVKSVNYMDQGKKVNGLELIKKKC